jgi:hypothetical protein
MKRQHAWYALLLLPFAGTLFPWIYNRAEPALLGMPFFYWLLGLVIYVTRERPDV